MTSRQPALKPVDWETIKDALIEWFAETSGCETIWSGQSAPQPAYPYASLTILPGIEESGALDEEQIRPDGTLRIVGRRDFMLSCQIHVGPPEAQCADCDASMRMDSVLSSLAVPFYQEQLASAGVALQGRGQKQNLNLAVGTEWINRIQVDINFRYKSVIDADNYERIRDIGYFDKVEISSDLSPLQGTGSLNLDEEIFDPNA